jgi:hypothetical protein
LLNGRFGESAIIITPSKYIRYNMIIKLNDDYFLVIDEDFFSVKGSDINVTEWIEENGINLSNQGYLLISKEEAEAIVTELSWTWINRENPIFNQVIDKMMAFTRKKANNVG